MGWAMLLVPFVAFNLLMYACTRSNAPVVKDPNFVQETGEASRWYCRTTTGDWEFFPTPGFHPRTGEPLKPMTTEAVWEYDAWKQQKDARDGEKTAEAEKRAKTEAERRFRETYVNDTVLSSSVASANAVILVVKSDSPDSHGDALPALLADLLAKKDKRPLSGALKSAFFIRAACSTSYGAETSRSWSGFVCSTAPGAACSCARRIIRQRHELTLKDSCPYWAPFRSSW